MRVLIADQFQESGLAAIRKCGCDVTYEPGLDADTLRDAVERTHCDVIIVRSTKVTEASLSACAELGLVVRAGAGFNTIDVAAASKRSILVANCPGKNAIAVAELTFALILALDRRVVENVNDLRDGNWNKKEYSKARGLKGRTLGIVGMGEIGKAVASRAHAFGMHVAAWSRSLTEEQAADLSAYRCGSPAEVAEHSDVFSIHLAAKPQTKNIINAEVINRLNPGSYIINTSRAEVVDYDALAKAVNRNGIRVGLDVYPNEPSSSTDSFRPGLLDTDGIVYGTHHIGASTEQAQDAIANETIRIVRTYQETGRVINCVNLREASSAIWSLTVRHLNKPGVLAHVLNVLSHDGINVEEMDNVITSSGDAACAHIHLDARPSDDVLTKISADNVSVLAVGVTKAHQA